MWFLVVRGSVLENKKQTIKYSALAVIVFSLLAHGYRFSNNMFTHDSLLMIYQNDYAWQIALGRITQPILIFLRGSICNPWLISMAFVIWMIFAVYFTADLLEIKQITHIVLVAGIMICNVIITVGNAAYLPWIDFYALACCLSVMGVWCLKKAFSETDKFAKKQLIWMVLAIISLAVSIGIYQSYICVAIGLMMMLLVKDLATNMKFKSFFTKAFGMAVCLILAALIYYVAWKIFQRIFNIWTSDGYNGLASVGDYSDTSILGLFFKTYKQVWYFIWNPDTFATLIYHEKSLSFLWLWILRAVNIVVIGYTIIAIVYANAKNKTSFLHRIIQLVLVMLFPFGINLVSFISKGMEHTLMIYAFVLVYVAAIYFSSFFTKNISAKIVCCALLAVVIWVNIVYANQVYLKKELQTEASTAMMSRIVSDIEDVEGYIPGETPVAFYGNFQTSEYVKDLIGFEDILPYGMGKSSVTYYGVDYALLSYILNVDMNLTRVDTSDGVVMETVDTMPCYPASGSIGYIGDTIVVKIAEY